MIRKIFWIDPVSVRLRYLYVRPISRTFLRVSVCPSCVICPRLHVLVRFTVLLMILAYEYFVPFILYLVRFCSPKRCKKKYCTVPCFSHQFVVLVRVLYRTAPVGKVASTRTALVLVQNAFDPFARPARCNCPSFGDEGLGAHEWHGHGHGQ